VSRLQQKRSAGDGRSVSASLRYDDSAKAFADAAVGAVVIAVDAPRHYEIAKAALQAGKHVYVEKPLALSSVEAKELVDLAAAGKCN